MAERVTDSPLDYSRYFWQGAKVRLRPLRLDDVNVNFIVRLDSPSRQVLQLGVELPTTIEAMQKQFEKLVDCQDDGNVVIFVMETLAGVDMGSLALHSRRQKDGTFSFGVIVYREHWGNGYAVDAVRILLKYGFWECRYQKCNSACVHTNAASIRMHEKLGFVQEGRIRRNVFFDGEYHDDILWGMTREEFDAIMQV